MNAKDLSILSYKELQALAVKYRVPGNIKKDLLVKILNAVTTGNNSEVSKILTDLKKNRKKRTKRAKNMKEDDISLKLEVSHTPDLAVQQDNYLFPMQQQQQQQYPYQWLNTSQVGAEEEVKCNLSYNDIRRFLFLNCDRNNNQTLLDEIVDLRTEATVSNYQSNLGTNTLITSPSQQQSVAQPSTSDSASKKMSLLLKKMLQAPAGANLGEIASPVSTWPTDPCRVREPSPDNSETMSARSDINENDEIWQNDITPIPSLSCTFENDQGYLNSYCRRSNDISYYRPSFDNIGDQTILGYDQQNNQYQFSFATQTDAQENCRSWLASNSLDMTNPVDYETTSPLKPAPTAAIHYQNPGDSIMLNSSPIDSSNILQQNSQFCLTSDPLYTNQTTTALEPNEILPDIQFDVSQYYELSSNTVRTQEPQDYYRQLSAVSGADTSTFSQDFYDNTQQQQVSLPQSTEQCNNSSYSDYTHQLTSPIFHIELENASFDSGYYQQSNNQDQQQNMSVNQSIVTPATTATDPLQPLQDQQLESFVGMPASSTTQYNAPTYGTGVLENYWPRWSYLDKNAVASKTNGQSLEITLNLRTSNCNVDFSKLNETCCVYSNTTPVMTLRKGLNSVPSVFESKSSINTAFNNAEDRQHNFIPNWVTCTDETSTDVSSNRNSFTPSNTMYLAEFSTKQQPEDSI